jgi:branched-chain amino acid aminotransferase
VSAEDELAAVKGVAYMDGRYMPLAEASIPVIDRGFLRSDVTYDALHVWRGRIFRLQDHIARFRASMAGLQMSLPHTDVELTEVLMECVRRTGERDAFIMVMCSRGVQPPGTRDPRLCRNRLYAYAQPFLWIANEEQRRDGFRMILSKTQRIPSEALDQRIKNFHWLDLTMSLFEAYERDATVTLLPLADGTVTEGPGFNVFIVKDGILATPDRGVFEGITRRTVTEIAADLQLRCEWRPVRCEEVEAADEIFTSTTAGGITPVTQYEGRPVGDGKPGSITRRILELYWRRHEDDALNTPIRYDD